MQRIVRVLGYASMLFLVLGLVVFDEDDTVWFLGVAMFVLTYVLEFFRRWVHFLKRRDALQPTAE